VFTTPFNFSTLAKSTINCNSSFDPTNEPDIESYFIVNAFGLTAVCPFPTPTKISLPEFVRTFIELLILSVIATKSNITSIPLPDVICLMLSLNFSLVIFSLLHLLQIFAVPATISLHFFLLL
jgi:hypothetical protein